MKRVYLSVAGAITALLVIFLVSCSGGSTELATQTPGQPTIGELTDFLYSEMERLGVDPNRQSSSAPAGNEVFDLTATVDDPDGEGPEEPSGITLAWTEQLIGDYDQNGEVGLSDLTPLAIHYSAEANYDPADERNGISWWPTGDPENGGALNWRKARVDGDRNGEINLADVTQIALHWGERIDGYKLYERIPGTEEFSVVPNAFDPESGFTVPRSLASTSDPNKPVRYKYLIAFEPGGATEFKLSKFDSIGGEGGLSELYAYENEPPVAELTAYPISGEAPLTVQFDASGSYDPDGYYLWFEWDFDGDGVYDFNSGTDSTVEHTYDTPGYYDATVKVRDYPGATDTASVLITVTSGNPTGPPVAVLTAYPVSGNAPLVVQFDASGSSDPDGDALQFEWDFDGDGGYDLNTGTEPTTVYTYGTPGYYDATVRVTDSAGNTDTASVLVTVTYGSSDPVANIVADYLSVYAPVYVRFDASGSYDSDGEIVRYEWDFNSDGIIDHDSGAFPKAATIYLSSGVRYVRVTVTDNDGNTDTASLAVSFAAGNDRLFIFPDPLDKDWHDVTGYGVYDQPYIVSSVYYNTNLQTEFSMVAYWYESDSSTSIAVEDLTWVGYPPYNTEWVGPAIFKATDRTIGNVYAYGMTDPIRTSVQVFIRNTASYPY